MHPLTPNAGFEDKVYLKPGAYLSLVAESLFVHFLANHFSKAVRRTENRKTFKARMTV